MHSIPNTRTDAEPQPEIEPGRFAKFAQEVANAAESLMNVTTMQDSDNCAALTEMDGEGVQEFRLTERTTQFELMRANIVGLRDLLKSDECAAFEAEIERQLRKVGGTP